MFHGGLGIDGDFPKKKYIESLSFRFPAEMPVNVQQHLFEDVYRCCVLWAYLTQVVLSL